MPPPATRRAPSGAPFRGAPGAAKAQPGAAGRPAAPLRPPRGGARRAKAPLKRGKARKGTIPPLRAFTALAARGAHRAHKKSALRERDALPSRSLALQYSRRRRA